MDVEQIKDRYDMEGILSRFNIRAVKGFCKCPFHNGDNTPSMKVYKKGFYCFGCNIGGDFIKFVQLYNNLDFREACEWISGEQLPKKTKRQIAIAEIKRNLKESKEKDLKAQLANVNKQFTDLWQKYLNAEPFSDEWCEAYNKWQYLCYQQESIIAELGET